MLKKIFAFALLTTLLAACGSKSALNYNQEISDKENSLEPAILETESNVKRYMNASEYDSVAVAGAAMEEKAAKVLEEVKALKTPNAKGIDEFRSAVINYFTFIKDVYASYKNVGNAPTEEVRAEEWQKFQVLLERKDEITQEMQASQRKFADDNGFKIKE